MGLPRERAGRGNRGIVRREEAERMAASMAVIDDEMRG